MRASILLLLILLGPHSAWPSGFQIGAGGFTPHYFVGPGEHNYCNQIGESNVIFNRLYYFRIEGRKSALTYLNGVDSSCSPIQGLLYTYKVYEGRWFGFGITGGGYRFNMPDWIYEETHVPLGKQKITPIYTKVGGNIYIVPVIAAEFNFGLLHLGSWSLWLNALVAPYISNISISLKETF